MGDSNQIIITGSILGIGALIGLGVYLYNLQVSKPVNEIVVQAVSDLTDPCTVQVIRESIDPCTVAEEATGGFLHWISDATIQALSCGAILEPYYGVALGLLGLLSIKPFLEIKPSSELRPSSVIKPSSDTKPFLFSKMSLLTLMVIGGPAGLSGDGISGEGSSSLDRGASDSQDPVGTKRPRDLDALSSSGSSGLDKLLKTNDPCMEELLACIFSDNSDPAFQQFSTDFAYQHKLLASLKRALESQQNMVDKYNVNAELANLWFVSKTKFAEFENKVYSAEAAVTHFDCSTHSSSYEAHNIARKNFVDDLSQKLRAIQRAPVDALTNVVNEIKRYEADIQGRSGYVPVDFDRYRALHKKSEH